MQLSKRLLAVASLVTPNNRVVDVGCDHAYTSIYLVENNIIPYAIAMDINQGPIDRARENIKKYGFEARIDARKSTGLEKLSVGEADTILIAGMGGALTIQILSEQLEVVKAARELVLQPQSEIHLVRRMLHDNGFFITKENMIKDDGKYYVMMKAEDMALVKDKEAYDLTKKEHFYYGRILLEQQHPILSEFLLRELRLCENLYRVLVAEPTQNSILRQKEIMDKIELIEQGLRYYQVIEKLKK